MWRSKRPKTINNGREDFIEKDGTPAEGSRVRRVAFNETRDLQSQFVCGGDVIRRFNINNHMLVLDLELDGQWT